MDIVFLIDHFLQGGAEAQLWMIATRLQRRGWKVGILTMLPSTAYLQEFEAAGIPLVQCASGRKPVRMMLRMVLQLRRWRPGVLITFNYHADIMGRLCGRLAGVPVVLSSLRTAHVKSPWRGRIYRFTEALVDLTVSNSQAAVSHLQALGALTPEKTVVIPNGILLTNYPAPVTPQEARSSLAVPAEAFAWLAVGNLLPSKDYPTLLEAARICAAVEPRFRLCVVGGGDALGPLRAAAAGLGLDGAVVFLGQRTDVPKLLRACDAYVLSSAWEGMPNTVMEAMASGTPVVATDAGGVRELIGPGEAGLVVPVRDPRALAEAMLALMALGVDDRHRMGQAGRERIRQQFDIESAVDRWEEVIQRQLARKGPGPAHRRTVEARAEEGVAEGPVPQRVPPRPPAFIISLDFELMWGVRDKRTIQTYGDNIMGSRQAIPAMLKAFRNYEVKATWATVGMLLFDDRDDLLRHLPDLRPTYDRPALDSYAHLGEVGRDEKSDPYHFGLSLVGKILECEGMELGSHTFSHYYCLEKGQDLDQFRADLAASAAATARLTHRPVSLVFPRNQCNPHYLPVCSELGFKVFRGNERAWMYQSAIDERQSLPRRGARLLDNYLPLSGHNGFAPRAESGLLDCPSSRFLRPVSARLSWLDAVRLGRIKAAMESAAKERLAFHLWWHPHNFGSHLNENLAFLDELLRFHSRLRDRYGVVPMTMGDVARAELNSP